MGLKNHNVNTVSTIGYVCSNPNIAIHYDIYLANSYIEYFLRIMSVLGYINIHR